MSQSITSILKLARRISTLEAEITALHKKTELLIRDARIAQDGWAVSERQREDAENRAAKLEKALARAMLAKGRKKTSLGKHKTSCCAMSIKPPKKVKLKKSK